MKNFLFGLIIFSATLVSAQLVSIPSPLNKFYHSGTDFSRHHEVVQFFETLESLYPKQVKVETYGYTNEGRPLIMAFISTEKNFQARENIRVNHLSSNKLENTSIAWLSYNVHGNESCGTEAAMETAYRLVTTDANLLENTLVIMDPCLNPDGRDRYVNYFKQYHNKTGQLQVPSAEHDETWPGGRPNHYLFDLNRDWAWLTQVESQQRIKVYNQWLPHVHVDFHEQGMNEPYYFPPAAEPYHEVITNWQRDFQKHIGKNHASYFDKNGWLYFSKEIFDLLYPSYGDTYPTFNGAIGMTYEQGGSGRAGLGVITMVGDTLTLAERIEHHVISGISTLETVKNHHIKLIEEFQKFQEKNLNNPITTYVLDGSSANLSALTTLLDRHQIRYTKVNQDQGSEVKGFDYYTNKEHSRKLLKNDVIISTNQQKGNLINVLFEQKTALTDSLTYDITAWSLPYAYGVPCMKTLKSIATPQGESNEQYTPFAIGEEPYAIAIPWNNINDVRILNELLSAGLNVSMTEKEFTTSVGKFNKGTLLVLKSDNPGKSLSTLVAPIINKHKEKATALFSGWAESGTDLGSSSIKNISQPKIGILFNDQTSSLSMGEIWNFLDAQLGIEHQVLRNGDADLYALSQLDVLLIPEGFQSENNANLKQWISNGGTCIVMGSGAANFMEADFGMKIEEGTAPIVSRDLGNYGNLERSSISETIIGAIYQCNVDTSHPLAFGYKDTYFTLRLAPDVYPFQGDIIQKIQEKNGWITGFAGYKVKHKQQGAVTVGSYALGEGNIVYFFDNPLFRGFWENGKLQVANAIYFLR
jgi:hypothetical protein